MKSSKDIRKDFIEFFQSKNHTFVPSSPVFPHDDPTLLFTNAGMNQFKDVFLGRGDRPYRRAVNSQKCIRVSGKHNDLEEVGHDTYHHTFFEMLGNWSFGDYYKKEAIQWAWELFTVLWGIPEKKLWATVYQDDDEAEKFWKNVTSINPKQVLHFGEKDNFWEMGATGPCGPSSEIHIDLGEGYCDKSYLKDHQCKVNGGCGRFIELWNLVFIQFNRDDSGVLHSLPHKHIDTGMGFERIVAVLQHVKSNYDTDLFIPIIEKVEIITGINYHKVDENLQIAFRVLADHIRMLTIAITDGALPSNEGRGYVLRRVLRRASRYAHKLDMHNPFIYELVPVVVGIMGDAFPEVKGRQSYVMEVVRSEEENFIKTLDRGLKIFAGMVKRIRDDGGKIIPGKDAFRLYDTYGFPLDLTRVLADENNLSIDEMGFDNEMEIQRDRARKAGKFITQVDQIDNWNVLKHCSSNSHFVGYDTLEVTSDICKFAKKNDQYHLVLTETPFYAESGGQVADKGKLILENMELEVIDVRKEGNEIIHVCEGPENLNIIHSSVIAKVDEKYRYPTMYNHTSTHLLHGALRQILGDHVEQAGSLVAPDRFRFDFKHFKKIEKDELEKIEAIVNDQVRRDSTLEIFYTEFDKARELGAIALFGEKYGDQVRVVSIPGFSKELCGGTHVSRTGQIGSFIIIQESSIASGVRRIEAITGPKAIEFTQKSRNILNKLSQTLNSTPEELPEKIKVLRKEVQENERILQKLQAEQAVHQIDGLLQEAESIGEVKLAIKKFQNIEVELLKKAADEFRQKSNSGMLLMINQVDSKLNFILTITDDLIKKGLHAGNLVKELAKITQGGGGGRAHLATAGGKNPEKLDEAIAYLKILIEKSQK
ncbi:MAG: alanine--tRNA ligase [Calditrichia bacterium]|nr:alanine--tRNA ligase [Calditrichia bacterium]